MIFIDMMPHLQSVRPQVALLPKGGVKPWHGQAPWVLFGLLSGPVPVVAFQAHSITG